MSAPLYPPPFIVTSALPARPLHHLPLDKCPHDTGLEINCHWRHQSLHRAIKFGPREVLVEFPSIHHLLLPLRAWQRPPAPSPKSFANHDNPCIWLMKTISWCFPLPQHPKKCTKSVNSSVPTRTMPHPPAPPPAVPSSTTTAPRPLSSSTITGFLQRNGASPLQNQPRIPPLPRPTQTPPSIPVAH